MDDKVIVGIGEALWDVLPEGKKIGGAPANFAYHVSQFGLESCAVSAVGDDELGKEIRSNFEEKKLQTLIETVPYPTGTVQVEIDKLGVPQYDIKENVAWDNIPFTPQIEELAHRTKAICFGSLAQRNEVSGLMIMGLFGGTVFPLAMGFAADALGQTGAIGVMSAGVAYLLYYTLRIK